MHVPPSRAGTYLNVGLALVGGLLLILTIRQVGWFDVRSSLGSLGWWFAVVLVLGGIRFGARAAAWRACAGPDVLPLDAAFSATLAGDALGNLTPLGLLASEPAKAFLVRDRVPPVQAVSSIAVENAFYMTSVLLMIGAGTLVFIRRSAPSSALRLVTEGVLATVVVACVAAIWIARRRPAMLSRLARTFVTLTGRGQSGADRLHEIEASFYALLGWPVARLLRVAGWEAVFHVAAVAEVFLVLSVLVGGGSATILDAFVLETAGRLVVVAFKFIPYRLGVDEAGAALVARALALDPVAGVALALIRRLRTLCWNAVGVTLLLRPR